MWLMCIHSWGNWVVFLVFGSIAIIVLKLWNDRRTLLKFMFKTELLANLLWIVWYDYMKLCEWLMSVEYDVNHSMMYFSPLLELWEIIWSCWFVVMLLILMWMLIKDMIMFWCWLWWCLLIIKMMLVELLCCRCWWIVYVYLHMCCWWSFLHDIGDVLMV